MHVICNYVFRFRCKFPCACIYAHGRKCASACLAVLVEFIYRLAFQKRNQSQILERKGDLLYD